MAIVSPQAQLSCLSSVYHRLLFLCFPGDRAEDRGTRREEAEIGDTGVPGTPPRALPSARPPRSQADAKAEEGAGVIRSPRSGAPSAVSTVNCTAPAHAQRLSIEKPGNRPASCQREEGLIEQGQWKWNQKAFLSLGVRAESILCGLRWGGCGNRGGEKIGGCLNSLGPGSLLLGI